MSSNTKGRIIKIVAVTIDIIAPLVATLTQFPVWIEHSAGATVSGVVLILAFLCIIPFFKQITAFLKSPSVPILWLATFTLLTLLNNIIDQMIVVCFVGAISNTIGTFIYKIGDKLDPKPRKE
jgi:hypothetical protein